MSAPRTIERALREMSVRDLHTAECARHTIGLLTSRDLLPFIPNESSSGLAAPHLAAWLQQVLSWEWARRSGSAESFP